MMESQDLAMVNEQQDAEFIAQIYGLLACLLRETPNQAVLDWLTDVEIADNGNQAMTQAWQALKQAATKAKPSALEREFYQLFIGIGRGEVVPFASWHITGSLMEKPLVAIRQDLKRLGFEREDNVKEPEDSMVALLEVMSLLQAEPLTQQQAFFNAHIMPWYEKLCVQIETAPSAQFYQSVAQLLRQFCLVEQTRLTQKNRS